MTEAAAPNPAWRRPTPAAPARLLSDDRLARRASEGDERAFAEIYSRYADPLYRFCFAMVGDPQDAQDALHNTMVKALRALPGEERRIQLRPWLYRIARNESVEVIRRRRDTAELEPDATPAAAEITETVEARDRLRGLIGDLEELPERQRAALVMRELAGLSFERIAESFETSAAVARQTVYEARLSLRQMEEGREMSCDAVMHELSNRDGRIPRRRELRAHLRHCPDCRAFREGIAARSKGFAAIAPLPAVASASLLSGLLGGSAGAAGGVGGTGGLAGTLGAAAGKLAGASAVVKTATTVAVVAAVGAGAESSGLVDVPVGVGDGGSSPGVERGHEKSSANGPNSAAPGASVVPPRGGETAGAGNAGSGEAARHAGPASNGKALGRDGAEKKSASNRDAGHETAATHGGGRPESLPPASGRGQENAAAHKAPQARSTPGPAPSEHGGNRPEVSEKAPIEPAPQAPSSPPKKEAQSSVPPAPEPEPAAGTGTNAVEPAEPTS